MATTPTAPRSTGPAAPIRVASGGDHVDLDGGIRRFDGSVVKVLSDGTEVLSDHILPGEKLRSEVTDRYAAVKPLTDKGEADKAKDAHK